MSLVVGYEFSLGRSTGIGVKSTNDLYKVYFCLEKRTSSFKPSHCIVGAHKSNWNHLPLWPY